MNRKKNCLVILSLAVMAFSLSANAQTYGTITITPAAMTNLNAGGVSNLSAVVDCRYNRNLNFQLSGAAIGTNSSYTLKAFKSADAVSYDTTTSMSLVLNIPTNTVNVTNINVDVGAVGWLTFSLTGGANVCTNVAVVIGVPNGPYGK